MSIQVGSLVLVDPVPISNVGHRQWMVVLEIADDQVWLVPATNQIELAGDLDIVLTQLHTSFEFDIAVLTHLEIQISKSRLRNPISQLQEEVIVEIDACQNGSPGGDFIHGHLMRTEQIDWRFSGIKSIDAELTRSFSEQAWQFYESIAPLIEEMNLPNALKIQLATSNQPNSSTMKTRHELLVRLSTSSPRAQQKLSRIGQRKMNEMVSA